MPFTNLNLITVTGKYFLLNGNPALGSISFTPSIVLTDTVANEIIYPTAFTVNLDTSGAFSVVLPATTDPDLNPVGWTYEVKENIIGSQTSRTYRIELPYNLVGSTVDLADIVPVEAVSAVSSYVLFSTFNSAIADLREDIAATSAYEVLARSEYDSTYSTINSGGWGDIPGWNAPFSWDGLKTIRVGLQIPRANLGGPGLLSFIVSVVTTGTIILISDYDFAAAGFARLPPQYRTYPSPEWTPIVGTNALKVQVGRFGASTVSGQMSGPPDGYYPTLTVEAY